MNIKNKDILVLVSGKFSLLHPGHLRLLRFAKECGDKLIVALESGSRIRESEFIDDDTRLENIKGLVYVDDAFIFNGSIRQVIDEIKPDIVVKGKEHESRHNEESEALRKYNGKLIFSSGESTFSAFNVLQLEENLDAARGNILCKQFTDKNNISIEKLKKKLWQFENLNICVIGDAIVDEYVECEALGMSQEDPTIVAAEILSEKFLGGAGIVAAHAASLGAKVHFLSLVAEDESGYFIRNKLSELNIESQLYSEPGRPTTLKKRYRCDSKTLLRISKLHQNSINAETKNQIYLNIKNNIKKYDALIFSDFNYGCLPQDLVENIIDLCIENGVIVSADSQSSSQLGNITRYKKVDLITPTEREARIALRNREDGLPVLGDMLLEATNCKYTILKMGKDGLIVFANEEKEFGGNPLPAINRSAVDPSGAGDSLLVLTTMMLALKNSIWEAAYMGTIAAAIQVSRRGNIPLKQSELSYFLDSL